MWSFGRWNWRFRSLDGMGDVETPRGRKDHIPKQADCRADSRKDFLPGWLGEEGCKKLEVFGELGGGTETTLSLVEMGRK
jgi:hypothetical protein